MISLLLTAALIAAPAPKPPVNARCPACGGAVTAKSPKVAVRGQAYWVCCTGCGELLEKNPDKYLNKNGTPKNAQ